MCSVWLSLNHRIFSDLTNFVQLVDHCSLIKIPSPSYIYFFLINMTYIYADVGWSCLPW